MPELRPAPLAHHGYRTGCVCSSCLRRVEQVRSGRLYYDRDGKLKVKRGGAERQPWEPSQAA